MKGKIILILIQKVKEDFIQGCSSRTFALGERVEAPLPQYNQESGDLQGAGERGNGWNITKRTHQG